MHNKQISDLFDQMAEIMEILGEDHFRISTYRKVARVVGDCPQDIASLAAGGQLQTLAGIGKSSAEKINEFIHHGSIGAHQELLEKIPPGLLDLLKIPGFGPKGVSAVWKKLNVTNLPELQQAISDHSLETLPGFGAKKAQALARGIEFIRSSQNRILLADALAIADLIVGQLHQLDCLDRIELAGSLRRCCETIGDIDLLAQADGDDNTKKIIQAFTQLPGVQEVLATGQTKASIRLAKPDIYPDLIQVDLRVISSESMGAAWQYFTGSKYHNIRLREIAGRKKLKLNEYGLFKGDKQIAGQSELQIYKKLGLSYIPPTLREDRGEIESAQKGKLPEIIQLPDIRGDLHMHSPESDGRSSIEQLIGAARLLGYEYIAIADHSQSTAIANGLDANRLLKHAQRIRKLNETLDGFTILASSEVDILTDGDLDYPDEVLAELDFVTASIHSGMTGARDKLTDRILRAMENPYVNCIAHPTGRMLGVREAMALDIDAIIAQALRTHTALEINAQPLRLDLNDIHIRQAVDAGVKLIINTDAHDTASLKLMRFGVATAQRGWAKKTDILNCHGVSVIRDWVKDKRKKPAKTKSSLSIKEKVEYFKHPSKLWLPEEIIANPRIVPKKKGIYGWYFNGIPPFVPDKNYIRVNGQTLLYIGIAGKKPDSKSDLRERIWSQHLNGNAFGSTLRATLGSLLREKLGIRPYKKGREDNKGFWFGKKGEETLRNWLILHARIAWIEDECPWKIEEAIFKEYGSLLPLNTRDNEENNPFSSELTEKRDACKKEAWNS